MMEGDIGITNTERNYSIDVCRYLCAVLVVAIHIHPMSDVNPVLGYIGTQIIPGIAVPFFFAVSGDFYINILIAKGRKMEGGGEKYIMQLYQEAAGSLYDMELDIFNSLCL